MHELYLEVPYLKVLFCPSSVRPVAKASTSKAEKSPRLPRCPASIITQSQLHSSSLMSYNLGELGNGLLYCH